MQVEVVKTVEGAVVEELTEEEATERHRLESKVERAFYEAGKSLIELRDRRLYRSTHKTFEEYCRDRFGFTRRSSDYLIAGSLVVDNLRIRTNSSQILPSSETQCRPLTQLKPEQQFEVWQQAVNEAGGKVPTARLVKSIVKCLKQQNTTPPISSKPGDVFMIGSKSGELRKYNSCWAIATQINQDTVCVHVHDGDLTVKPENLEPIDSPSQCEQVRAIAQRIARLRQCGLLDGYELEPS